MKASKYSIFLVHSFKIFSPINFPNWISWGQIDGKKQ